MRIVALACLGMAALAAATLGARAPAWAEGAIAFGTTGKVERDGIAFGLVVDEKEGTAGAIAVERCRTFKAKAAAERCQVVATFSSQCFAIAYDPTPGTPGAGWGVGDDQLIANQKAVAMCEQSAGPSRKGYCQVNAYGCDTTIPKLAPKAGTDGKTDTVPDASKADVPKAETPKAETKPESDARPAPDSDARGTPDAKETTRASPEGKGASEAKEPQDRKEAEAPKDTKGAGESKSGASAEASPPSAPKATLVAPPKPQAGRAEPKGRGGASPLLPILALGGVALAYVAGQHVRGRIKGGLGERQILTGAALAVAAAIAVKLLDMAGAGSMAAVVLAGLIALVAAILA